MSYMKRLAETIREHDFEPTPGGYQHAPSCRLCARSPELARVEPTFCPDEFLCDRCGGPYARCAGCPEEDR